VCFAYFAFPSGFNLGVDSENFAFPSGFTLGVDSEK